MDFGEALKALRQGYVVKRASWTGVALGIVTDPPLEPDGRLSILYPDGSYTPFGKLDADLLAQDWTVAEEWDGLSDRERAGYAEQFRTGVGAKYLTRQGVVLLQEEPVPLCPDCLCPAGNAVIVRLEAA